MNGRRSGASGPLNYHTGVKAGTEKATHCTYCVSGRLEMQGKHPETRQLAGKNKIKNISLRCLGGRVQMKQGMLRLNQSLLM